MEGRDLGRPYPPRGGAMWPGLNSAEVRPVLHTSEMTQAGVIFFAFHELAGAILVRAAPRIAPNAPCLGPQSGFPVVSRFAHGRLYTQSL